MKPADLCRNVHINLAGRSYDILIGRHALSMAIEPLKALSKGGKAGIILDETVAHFHQAAIETMLNHAGIAATFIKIPAGEKSKSWAELGRVIDALLEAKLERGDLVIAFGGGVVGDLAGFAAAITRRGMRYVQIPTSLLAQVDSSVGGKTAVNATSGKNLIGAFHQPVMVVADTALLDTLPLRQMRAGYAEVIKYGLINDKPFYDWLEGGAWRGVFAGTDEREEAVARCCMAKGAIVERDETETGDRALLNLGHTFGHALERLTGYSDRLLHGEGVSIGMVMAHRFSQRLGLCSGQDALRVEKHLAHVGLPISMQEIPGEIGSSDAILEAIYQDKKVSRGKLTFILTRGIGESFIANDIAPAEVKAFLETQ